MGVEQLPFLCLGCLLTLSGSRGTGGPAHLTMLPLGMEASTPFEDQSFRLGPRTTTPDDKGTAAADCCELPRGVPTLCRGSGGLLALVLCLPSGPSGVVGR